MAAIKMQTNEYTKLSRKEKSAIKESGRKKRKAAAQERKSKHPKKKRDNPVSVTVDEEGRYIFHGRSFSITKDKNAALEPFGKVLSLRGKQLLLLPTPEQTNLIHQTNGCARVVRNDYLAKRMEQYKKEKTTLSVSEYKATYLKALKKEKPYLRDVDKFALESAVKAVDKAYQNFFDGNANFPKFVSRYKPNGNSYSTSFTNNNIEVLEQDGIPYVKLPKLGLVRFVLPKGSTVQTLLMPNTNITGATITKDGSNYLVSLNLETVVDKAKPVEVYESSRVIAMDMGLRKFCDYGTGDGDHVAVENPRWINKHEKRLRRFQKSLSRKQYDEKTHTGSKNWEKAKARVAKEQRKISNQRKDFQHKLSRKIADSCDVFICEDLNIKGMLKNKHLARQISSVGWGQFLMFVQYKLEAKGGIFMKVDRYFPSSKLCQCGYKHAQLKGELYWQCPNCHRINERDDNAVDNLIKEGMRILSTRNIEIIAA